MRAAAVNFPDLLKTRGEYQHKPPLPFIPGLEMAGVVAKVGEGVDALEGRAMRWSAARGSAASPTWR